MENRYRDISLTVGIDSRMYNMSGVGRYFRSILPGLIEKTSCRFQLYGYAADRAELEKFPRSEFIEVTSRIYHPKEHLEFKKKVKPCDIYFSPHFINPLLSIPAKRRIITIHDVFHISEFSIYNPLQKFYMRTLYKRCAAKADRIITVSEYSRAQIEKYIPKVKGRITVIPNSIDTSLFYIPPKAEIGAVKKEMLDNTGFGFDREFILFVGNVKPHKNLMRLLDAFPQIANRSLSLVIVGQKEGFIGQEKDFDRRIAEIPNLVFTGRVSDRTIRVLYSLAKFFVFPSYYEGFGYPPLEAMACGTPAAVSDIAVLREACGDAAYYFDPMSPESIARAIDTLDASPELRAELSKKGAEQVKKFTPESTLSAHLDILFGEYIY